MVGVEMSGKFWSKAWSLISGCTPVSEGCVNCWLASMAARFGRQELCTMDAHGIRPEFNGIVTFREDLLDLPLKTKKPTVFAIWSDLYHEKVDGINVIRAFDVMEMCPHHTFLIITKRPERAAKLAHPLPNADWHSDAPANAYHIVTCENQAIADERIPYLLKIPGKKGIILEPMLEPVNFRWMFMNPRPQSTNHLESLKGINFVILGSETGPNKRPIELDWIRSVRDQCESAGVPFFLKHIDKKNGRVLDGRTHDDLPWGNL